MNGYSADTECIFEHEPGFQNFKSWLDLLIEYLAESPKIVRSIDAPVIREHLAMCTACRKKYLPRMKAWSCLIAQNSLQP